jgi:GLPGLI family protein
MMALALTVSTQVQAQEDGGLADLKADMMAAMINQDSIDTSSLVAVYDYECHTQDADGQAVTDRMKVCVLVGQHCTRSFPYRKFLKEREWAEGEERAATDFIGLKAREYLGGYDFFSEEELPLLRSESYCMMPEVWTNYPDGKTTVRDAIPPSIYETQEARTTIDWTLTDDTVTIGGYLCKTATCQLHGRRWTVHYAEDIPTTAGPWKLCGLPGLITEAVSDGGIHRFTLIDLQRTAAPIYYETSAITVRTSEEKLIKNRIKTFGNRLYLKNPWGFISDHSNADKVHDTEGSLINGVYMHNRPHVFQPLDCK